MRIHNVEDAEAFLNVVNECEGSVWLESKEGDKINLKSKLSQYVAVGALVSSEGDNLELFCSNSNDTARFLQLFAEHKDIER